MESHRGLKSMHRNIRVAQWRLGTQGVTRIKNEDEMWQLELMDTCFTRMDGCSCMVLVDCISWKVTLYGFFSSFGDEICECDAM